MISKSTILKLWKAAKAAQKKADARYSHYPVGSALIANGKLYSGSNVENASYGSTICAEQMALGKAVNDGRKNIEAIIVVTNSKGGCSPCGLCLQMLSEFAKPKMPVIVATPKRVEYLIPFSELH